MTSNTMSAPGNRSAEAQGCITIGDSRKASIKLRVLLVEDDPADIELVLLALRKAGFDVSNDVVQTVEEFRSRIQTTGYDVILADYNLPQWSGMKALEVLRHEKLDVPLIVVTGYLGEEKAVDYIKQGASDCVLKDHMARLPASVPASPGQAPGWACWSLRSWLSPVLVRFPLCRRAHYTRAGVGRGRLVVTACRGGGR